MRLTPNEEFLQASNALGVLNEFPNVFPLKTSQRFAIPEEEAVQMVSNEEARHTVEGVELVFAT